MNKFVFIRKKTNFFIGICINTFLQKYNIYQITSVGKKRIGLKGLVEHEYLPSLIELKTSL